MSTFSGKIVKTTYKILLFVNNDNERDSAKSSESLKLRELSLIAL